MSRTMRMAGAVLLAALLNMAASGQSLERKTVPKEKPKSAHAPPSNEAANLLSADQQNAVWQLYQLLRLTKEFNDDFLKIRAQAQIADALWKYDEPRARDIFKDAFQAVDSLEPPENAGASKATLFAQLYSLKYKLRNEIILLISRHDSGLATEYVNALSQSASKEETVAAATNSAASNQGMLYMELAMRLAQTDTRGAARFVKLSIDSGINPMLVPVLTKIRGKDPAAADQLFAYAISVARREPVTLIESIVWMAPYLFPDFWRARQMSGESAQVRYVQVNPALVSRYLELAYTSIMTALSAMQSSAVNDPDSAAGFKTDCQLGQMMLPFFEQFAPESAATLRARLEGIGSFNSSTNNGRGAEESVQSKSLKDLIKEAEAAQGVSQKDALYARAAVTAAHANDFETAFSIAKKISDEPRRSGLEMVIRHRAALVALGQGEFDLAYDYGKDISDLKQRALVFGKIAVELYRGLKSDRAAGLLDEAAEFVMSADRGRGQVHAMLTLTDAAARFDPAKGFELMELAVRAANVETASAGSGPVKQAEKDVAGAATGTGDAYAEFALDFDHSLAVLARSDFNRALFLAQALRKREWSAFAQLAVCSAVLNMPRKS